MYILLQQTGLVMILNMWMEHIHFLSEISVEIYDQFYFEPVICLKPDFFLIECAKDLMRMNVSRRLPAIYYACPTGQSLDGRSWGNPTACLITDTGLTIMDVLDENMEDLLFLNRQWLHKFFYHIYKNF